jgi:cell division protein FtsB
MLSINLIPRSYFEAQFVRRLMVFFGVLLGLVLLAMLALTMMYEQKIARTNEQLQQVEVRAQQVEALEKQAADLRAEVKPIQDKIKYIRDVMTYNRKMVGVLQELARYTYRKVSYESVTPGEGGSTLTIVGVAPSIMDSGRYLLGLYRATNLFSGLTFSGVPGYRSGAGDSGQQAGGGLAALQGALSPVRFTAVCTLREPLVAPTPPGGAAPADAGAAAGVPSTSGMPPPGTPAALGAVPEPGQ